MNVYHKQGGSVISLQIIWILIFMAYQLQCSTASGSIINTAITGGNHKSNTINSHIIFNPKPNPKKNISYRGISTNSQTVWISGSRGTVLKLKSIATPVYTTASNKDTGNKKWRTNNANTTTSEERTLYPTLSTKSILKIENLISVWDTISPSGFEKFDFRDIESLDDKTAIVMSVGDSGRILKTINGGANWTEVYRNFSPNVFLDAIAMDWKTGFGFAIGDPQTKDELLMGDSSNGLKYIHGTEYINKIESTHQPNTSLSIQWFGLTKELNPNNSSKIMPSKSSSEIPSQKYFLMLITLDSGNSWHRIPACEALIPQDSIAAFFAGSGSSLHILNSIVKRNKYNEITAIDVLVGMAGGGLNPEFRSLKLQPIKSKKFQDNPNYRQINHAPLQLSVSYQSYLLSLGSGVGWGAYGGIYNDGNLYWVGGNYMQPNYGDSTINIFPKSQINRLVHTKNRISTIKSHSASSSGYKSGICACVFKGKQYLFAAGSNGLDFSSDQGKNWFPIQFPQKSTSYAYNKINENNQSPNTNFSGINAVRCYKDGVIVVGNQGKVIYLAVSP